jgi:class 3 adenylate cyclase/predicted ATPase
MQCSSCNANVPEGSKFCGKCGSALPRACPTCGHAVPAENSFCSECGTSLVSGIVAPSAPTAHRTAQTTTTGSAAERRQLTIMFGDMVGSSALSTRLDPEEQREVVSTFQGCCAMEIKRFGGMVAQYLGDGILAYFGYPTAHEDDAERAMRAALAILNAVGTLKPAAAATLQARIGIASGVVVVGDLVREGVTQENAAIGETTNLAARLQSLAEPNTLLICPETHRLVGVLFEYRDLGVHSLKGFAKPVHVRQVTGASKVENRFEARRGIASPLLGRDEELDLLLRRWEQAKRGEGRVVMLIGEAGIGKSRLTRALQGRLTAEPHTPLIYQCSPYHQDSALYPIIGKLLRAASVEHDDTAERKLDKLEALLAPLSESLAEDMPLLAALLSIPGGERYPLANLTPQRLKELTLRALLSQLIRLAARQPVLMVFEDLHWVDPTSLEFLSLTVDHAPGLRLLFIATTRPEFTPPWPSHRHISMVTLGRLGRSEVQALVESVTKGKALPPDVADQIVARTDGVPLFIEELTKTVLESGLLREAGNQYELTGPLPPIAIPSTLHASLLARLDRLASAKDVAQIGAAIGREFSYAIVAAVSALPEQVLQAALSRLVEAELIFQRGVPPDVRYQFKHVLVQDTAYATLLRASRKELHARIAQLLEAQFPHTAETQPEVLAHHYTEAGLLEPAIVYWHGAGKYATKRSANVEAVAHFSRALELLERLPDRAAHAELELQLLIALGPVLMMTRSSTAPEIARVYANARKLAQETGRSAELFQSVAGSFIVAFSRSDLPAAGRVVGELFDIAQGQDDNGLLLQAHHAAWPMAMTTGDLLSAWRHGEAGLALYRRDAHGHHAHIYYGHDPGVCGYTMGGVIRATLGYPDHAIQHMDRGLALARDLAHPPTLGHGLWLAAEMRQICREPRAVEELTGALLTVMSEHGSAVSVANATMLRGWARTLQGQVEEGLAELREGLAAWRATGSKVFVPYRFARAADACRVAGLAGPGLRFIAEALEAMEGSGDRWFEPELHRLRGALLLLSGGDRHEVEACYRRALGVARDQSARLLELRVATSLAQLWRDQGKHANARDLLAPVYNWFTEGFDLPDLKDARSLLAELKGSAQRSRGITSWLFRQRR